MVNHRYRGTDRLRSRRVSALGLCSISAGGAVWYLDPSAGLWPGILLLAGLTALLMARSRLWTLKVYNAGVVIFLATAALGVWSAYNQENAWNKFLVLVAAAVIFWGFANQGYPNYWVIIGIIAAWCLLISTHFLLTHDWISQPADLSVINKLGEGWMAIRPGISLRQVHPNIVGGLLAALLPIQIFSANYAFKRGKNRIGLVLVAIICLSIVALFLTSSRAAWAGLGIALGIFFLWQVSSKFEASLHLPKHALLTGILLSLVILSFLAIYNQPDLLINLAGRIPGQPSTGSRLTLYQESMFLIQDFPIIGGGLTSFPGLYSEYILVTPFFFFGYAHNLYLDIFIEQGIFGLFALLTILFGSLAYVTYKLWSSRNPSRRLASLRWGAFAGLVVLILHGLLDDSFYGMEGTSFLFVLPALALTAIPKAGRSEIAESGSSAKPERTLRYSRLLPAILLIVFFFGVLYLTNGLAPSTWLANLGAVEMSKVELQDWPTGKWDEGLNITEYATPERLFSQSLEINAFQKTALYRMGLISMLKRDYSSAQGYLEKAFVVDPSHPGIRKSLGYTYVWLGEFDKAYPMIGDLEDTLRELSNYRGWWLAHERPDLADRAQLMLDLLNSNRGLSPNQIG